MKNDEMKSSTSGSEPYRVRLPGFVFEDIGVGTALTRATSFVGIRSCGGCARRAAVLNRWVVFSGSQRPTNR
jgi:hypothetical protein